jgi:hypothetical protein
VESNEFARRWLTTNRGRRWGASAMVKNHALALSISDAAMGELVRRGTYKSRWCRTEVIVDDQWFAVRGGQDLVVVWRGS